VPLRQLAGQARALAPTASVLPSTLAGAATRWRKSPAVLRVGVDIRPFYEPLTGVGWYLFHLLEALAQRDDVQIIPFGEPLLTDGGSRLHVPIPGAKQEVAFDLRGRLLSRFSRPLALSAYPALVRMQRVDLFFGANYFLPRALSSVATRRVVTVHDLTYRRFPELLQKETLENLNRSMLRELTVADRVICVSEATRRDLLEFYDVSPARVKTVLSGLAAVAEPGAPPSSLPQRYILFVSTIEPRKNVMTLIRAFEELKQTAGYDGKLVLVGKIGWKSEDVVKRLRTSRWRDDIVHLDYLERSTLAAVYAGAEVFVFPSLYEGFGFPLLEAMAYGVPTIAARSSSLPEVGGDATLYFDPLDADALTRLLRELTCDDDLKRSLIEKGRARVALFSWERAADETMKVFREAAQ
jgi:glycosyltransferase involved in cell wall biosynthesis